MFHTEFDTILSFATAITVILLGVVGGFFQWRNAKKKADSDALSTAMQEIVLKDGIIERLEREIARMSEEQAALKAELGTLRSLVTSGMSAGGKEALDKHIDEVISTVRSEHRKTRELITRLHEGEK